MRNYKSKFVKLVIFFFFLIIIFLCVKWIIRILEPTNVFEISNTRFNYNNSKMGFVSAKRYAMIINPPKSSEELKELMLDYCKKNKKMLDNMDGYKSGIKKTRYFILFYKEGRTFSRNWKPELEEQYGIIDLMQNYADYCLGSVVYESNGSDVIEISVKEWVGNEIEEKIYTTPISYLIE